MKLAINIGLSLGMLGLCLWLVWPSDRAQEDLRSALANLDFAEFWPYLLAYVGLLALTHFCRAWRWNSLLRPIEAELPPVRLLAIASVGFMFILALPARLGEFVRPALVREKGRVSLSAALGTIVVERIVDGLMVSLLVAAAVIALRDSPFAQWWMWWAAYVSLGVFALAMGFLALALKWPQRTVDIAVKLTLARFYAPRAAAFLEDKLHAVISGFLVLKRKRDLATFVVWSLFYWGANGLSVWVLARGFGLDLSVVGAYAVMGMVAVGIILPNAPALMGQYQWFTTLGLSLYVGEEVASGAGLAFAIVLWALQVIWYIGIGTIALTTPYVSFADVWRSRKLDEEPAPPSDEAV